MKPFRSFAFYLFLAILAEAFYLMLAWLYLRDVLRPLALCLSLFNYLLLGFFLLWKLRRRRQQKALLKLWQLDPEKVLPLLPNDSRPFVESLLVERDAVEKLASHAQQSLNSQKETLEAFVHEMKSPLFLLRLLLDQHEFPHDLRHPLEHVHESLQNSVDKILVASQLDSPHPDLAMEKLALRELLEEIREEKAPILRERKLELALPSRNPSVLSSRRELRFILTQLLNNAVKYADAEKPRIKLELLGKDFTLLRLWNNGLSVPPEDRPFLFDKGFCGTQEQREKASGMGLYLAHGLAVPLGLKLEIEDEPPEGEGFAIRLLFPRHAETNPTPS